MSTTSLLRPNFTLSPEQIDAALASDSTPRVFIDYYEATKDNSGKKYKGEWNQDGEPHGLGVQLWPDGSKFEGAWANGQSCGFGRMTHANGDIYEGEWARDMANGSGVFVDHVGATYSGAWEDDK